MAHPGDVRTTDGKLFTYQEHGKLAELIYRRWGSNLSAATAAYRRLMQNGCTEHDFQMLLDAAREEGELSKRAQEIRDQARQERAEADEMDAVRDDLFCGRRS
jgi:hypothetical protein